MVEIPGERVRHRLSLVVVVEAGQVAPAAVAAHLDQPGAELDAEQEPTYQHDEAELRSGRGGGGGESGGGGLQKEGVPTEGGESLADADAREGKDAQESEER